MISIRHSPDRTRNTQVKRLGAKRGESNTSWLRRAGMPKGLLLLGGNSLSNFRLRIAQAHMRSDMLPSFWSTVGILNKTTVLTVSLDHLEDSAKIPSSNGIAAIPLAEFDDPARYPNIAVLRFATEIDGTAIDTHIDRVRKQRAVIDLPSLIVPWLAFIWGAGKQGNPLLEGQGIPSAAFVETVYGIAGIELTPGVASPASCPEAIWQAAAWWHSYYKQSSQFQTGAAEANSAVPAGYYELRQIEAAAIEHKVSTRNRQKR